MKIEYEPLHKDYKPCIDEDGILDMIAKCAYRKSEKRDFADGYELQNWLEAEDEVGKQCSYWFQDVAWLRRLMFLWPILADRKNLHEKTMIELLIENLVAILIYAQPR